MRTANAIATAGSSNCQRARQSQTTSAEQARGYHVAARRFTCASALPWATDMAELA